ncbi:MAG: GAF domain-containing protein, partial [candidate division WOR-3 bacterium]
MIFEQENDPKALLSKIENLTLASPFDLTYILAAINKITKAQTSGIFLNIENRLVYIATYGKNDNVLLYQSLLEDESVEGYIFKNNDVLIPKSLEFEHFKPNSSSAISVMPITIVGTPLVSGNKTIGGMISFNREKNTLFTQDDLKVLKSLSLKIGEFLDQNRNRFQFFEKKLFLINKTIIESFPFPFFLTSTTGKIENFSEKTKNILKRSDLLGKDIFEVFRITKSSGEEVNLKEIFEEVVTKATEKILKNVRINNNFDEIYNLTIKYINPDKMIHNILFYFINTEDINEEKQKIVTNLS